MMKRVLGVEGDVMSSGDEGIAVKGKLLPASVPKELDCAGRALPRYEVDAWLAQLEGGQDIEPPECHL
ncbi:Signal peptidase, peptidase S26 [Nitrosospira multiformis]|uniref:Signal peptidase, peptidase S26 n=1 Tax=Nitrosospira multiformis TaxID=1231 RepID=A0A1I0EC11_9PROT|nr:S26 family signal peptidase [Nitrosospira multiformis]SET42688.1 Signal peptidase, peptidase S26 [Nitrosospira multiformis]